MDADAVLNSGQNSKNLSNGGGSNEQYLSELRELLVRFAQLQLGDLHLAEDAVQDAMLGAHNGFEGFSGQSAYKTWVFAILKNKIADILRQQNQWERAKEVVKDLDQKEHFDSIFNWLGRWHKGSRPVNWGEPESSFHQEQFWTVFDACLNNLPAQQGRVYMMREYVGLEVGEICQQTKLTKSNLYVLLHRARINLQRCLGKHWFN